jgi:hypothetical protein
MTRKTKPARRSPAPSDRKPKHPKGRKTMAKEDGKPQDLEQVRDLLFGAQMREADRRFVVMEERLAAASNDLRDEIRKRFTALEQYIKAEIAALTDQLKKEQAERLAAVKQLTSDLASTAKSLEKFADQTGADLQKLRGQLLEQSKQLRDDLSSADAAQTRARVEAVEDLRDAKADRAALAAMLNDIAMQLAGKGKKK